MKITNSALEYFEENNIKDIFIVPKLKVSFYGSCCVGGTKRVFEPEIKTDLTLDETFKTFDFQDVKVHVKERISDGVTEETEVDYKKGILGEKLTLNKFDQDLVKKTEPYIGY